MFPTPRQGNVHPSVANKLGAGAALVSAVNATPAGASSYSADLSGAFNTNKSVNSAPQLTIDEAEARAKAREILTEFVQQRTRASELESQLQRSLLENERVGHLLHERRTEAAVEKERAARELENLRRHNSEAEALVEASRDEVRRVAQACAQRASDTSAHLRLKEQETMQLEAELLKAREEARQLRAEVARLHSVGSSVEDAEQTQQRLVDLARRLLESEKSKAQLERSIAEDRRYQQQSLRTIESLRKQAQETDDRLREAEKRVETERDAHDRAIAALHREMDSQRDMYKQFVERIGSGGIGNGASDAALASLKAAHNTQIALLTAQLDNSKEIASKFADQVDRANKELADVKAQLAAARTQHVSEIAEIRSQLNQAEFAVSRERENFLMQRQDQARDKESLEKLRALHEQLKTDYAMVVTRISTAEAALRDAAKQHEVLETLMRKLKDEGDAREAVERHVADLLENRRGLEKRLADECARHDHEMQLLKMQMAAQQAVRGGGTVDANALLMLTQSSSPYRELERESQALKARAQEFEADRDRWEAERRAMIRAHDDEKRSMQQDMDRLTKIVEEARIAAAEARVQQGAAQREREEWAAAFAYSERCRSKLQGRVDELEAERHDITKERATSDTRLSVLQSQLQRLEQQTDRDSQEIFRLRRTVAALEVDLAKRDADVKRLEIARLEAMQQSTMQLASSRYDHAPSPIPNVLTPLRSDRSQSELASQREQLAERSRDLELRQLRYRALDNPEAVASPSAAKETTSSALDAAQTPAANKDGDEDRMSPESALAQMATKIFARTRASSLPPQQAVPPSAQM